jgi:hypothetical protein
MNEMKSTLTTCGISSANFIRCKFQGNSVKTVFSHEITVPAAPRMGGYGICSATLQQFLCFANSISSDRGDDISVGLSPNSCLPIP